MSSVRLSFWGPLSHLGWGCRAEPNAAWCPGLGVRFIAVLAPRGIKGWLGYARTGLSWKAKKVISISRRDALTKFLLVLLEQIIDKSDRATIALARSIDYR